MLFLTLALFVDGLLAIQVGKVMGSFDLGMISFTFGALLVMLTMFHASLVRKSR